MSASVLLGLVAFAGNAVAMEVCTVSAAPSEEIENECIATASCADPGHNVSQFYHAPDRLDCGTARSMVIKVLLSTGYAPVGGENTFVKK